MKIEGLKKIISSGESITVEFKESKKKLNKDVYESVCSLLNRYGGHLFSKYFHLLKWKSWNLNYLQRLEN
ncbi:protein of unknown function [Petrocella atlantisensis]|uniref:Uncharacterized protein n=1 Tax=Petrocella atlantisensis TaxID=2173034 RepID=A0A3P7RZ71_9FIRM|nr:hypothetical protein [Petrocella atlantisensis]VDN47976.1 protein of unknown function [Petrocella atlantisensis]